jgi:hypothetical protein
MSVIGQSLCSVQNTLDPPGSRLCHYLQGHAGPHSWEVDDRTIDVEACRKAIGTHVGFELTDEDWEHFKVLCRALEKFHERDAKHRGLWTYFGAIDSAFQARAKATRTYNIAIQLLKDASVVELDGSDEDYLDDAVDQINYAAFFVRNCEAGRYG